MVINRITYIVPASKVDDARQAVVDAFDGDEDQRDSFSVELTSNEHAPTPTHFAMTIGVNDDDRIAIESRLPSGWVSRENWTNIGTPSEARPEHPRESWGRENLRRVKSDVGIL